MLISKHKGKLRKLLKVATAKGWYICKCNVSFAPPIPFGNRRDIAYVLILPTNILLGVKLKCRAKYPLQ